MMVKRFLTIVATFASSTLVSTAWAHNGEVPPAPHAPPPPPTPPRVVELIPPRWSWLHWWEANRNLKTTPGSLGQLAVQNPLPEETKDKLLKALTSILEGKPVAKSVARGGQSGGGAGGNGRGGQGNGAAGGNTGQGQGNGGDGSGAGDKKADSDQANGGAGGKAGGGQANGGAGGDQAQGKPGQGSAAPARKGAPDLRAAARVKNPKLRSAVLLALGRIGAPEALDILANAARTEKDENVRRDAITALGLLGTPEAKELLLKDPAIREKTLSQRSAASGLVEALNDNLSDELQKTVLDKNVNPASLATWALQNRKDPRAAELFRKILANSTSSWLASDAILYLGRMKDPQAIPLLADLLLATEKARQIAAYRALDDAQRSIKGDVNQAFRKYESQLKQGVPGDPRGTKRDPNLSSGLEWTYASELRGSAAMALGMIDHDDARKALIEAMNLPDDYYSDLFKGPALVSLGQIGDEECLKVLIIFLNSAKINLGKGRGEGSPLPGYAAMGLGLYARRADKRGAPANNPAGDDRPQYRQALDALIQKLSNPSEHFELRTGCALALGMSQRPEALPPLQDVAKSFRPGDESLLGYSFLARAMLHDKTILEPVKKFLAVVRQKTDTNGILGQRAAILALGLLDTEDAIPILKQAWNINYYASREVIVALSVSRSTTAGDMLLDLLSKSKDPAEQAFISLCLGEFYAKDPQSPLQRFLSDTNYMMKNENLIPYQQQANEFLFNYLIGSFGGEWK